MYLGGAGCVEHYYHLIFDGLMPLWLRLYKMDRLSGGNVQIHLPYNRGPLIDAVFAHFFDNEFEYVREGDRRAGDPESTVKLPSVTHHADVYDELKAPFREYVRKRFDVPEKVPSRVVLVERRPSAEYYLSDDCTFAKSGSDRRSIVNHEELASGLKARIPELEVVQLEDMDFADQVRMFCDTKLMIAQHGGALANMVWMDTGSKLLELRSPDRRECSIRLAKMCGLFRAEFETVGRHVEVDVDEVCEAVLKLL